MREKAEIQHQSTMLSTSPTTLSPKAAEIGSIPVIDVVVQKL